MIILTNSGALIALDVQSQETINLIDNKIDENNKREFTDKSSEVQEGNFATFSRCFNVNDYKKSIDKEFSNVIFK